MAGLNKLQLGVWGRIKNPDTIFLYIGNIADVFPNAQQFTNRFGQNTYRFFPYYVNGNDVEVGLSSNSFNLYYEAFGLSPNISYYIDPVNITTFILNPFRNTQIEFILMKGVTGFSHPEALRRVLNVRRLYFPNVTSVLGRTALWIENAGELLYLPEATQLSYDSNYNVGPIRLKSGGGKIYVHPSLETSDNGNMHKALNYAQNQGATIVFVQNYTSPTSISDLSVSNITSNTVQINFTTPVGSVNAIDYHEVWLEQVDVFNPVHRYLPRYKKITTSGQTLNGLISGKTYKLKLATCDIYLNGSGVLENASFSNEVTFTTL